MFTLNPCQPSLRLALQILSGQSNHYPPSLTAVVPIQARFHKRNFPDTIKPSQNHRVRTKKFLERDEEIYDEDDDGVGNEEDEEELPQRGGFRGREEEKDYDKDPEFADILGNCLDDPDKARAKVSSF